MLIREIQKFCDKYNIALTTFGRKSVNDPRFVFDLMSGRNPRQQTVDRVRSFMDTYFD